VRILTKPLPFVGRSSYIQRYLFPVIIERGQRPARAIIFRQERVFACECCIPGLSYYDQRE
jgi:hypothetical protein